jgi:hypothetical protein
MHKTSKFFVGKEKCGGRRSCKGSLYEPDLQKGKKKPKLSDIKVKFPQKTTNLNSRVRHLKESCGGRSRN